MTVSKTALGVQVMKDRSISLSAQQRSALILCDGKRSAEEVVKMTAAVGVSLQDIDRLVALGLINVAAAHAAALAQEETRSTPPSPQPLNSAPANELAAATTPDFSTALNAAITLCSNLGFKGFGLNMALTGVDSFEKLQKIAPEIRRVAGDVKYKSLHALIFGRPL